MGMAAGSSSSHQQQQQELLERLRGATGLGLEGLDSLVGLAAKQAAKEEELAGLRSQVRQTLFTCWQHYQRASAHLRTPSILST
jgi:hypothetical protein